MTNRPSFNLRLRQYTPLGDPAGILPDLGFTVVAGPDGPTLSAQVSTVIAGSLPDDCEVAVEVWADSIGAWQEGRDSRFVIVGQDADDRDRTGTVTLTGVGLLQWLAQKAALASVVPYSDSGNVEAAASSSSVSVSHSTFTWASHILGTGDRVRVTDAGKAKGLSTGSVWYVRNPSGSTFQVSHTPSGAIKSFGSSSKVHLERVRTRIVNLDGHKFGKNMAISVWDATANQALTNGSLYYVVNPTPGTIQVATKPGGIPVELVADALTVYRYLDGQRVFKNETPGQVLGDPFLEARDRGWGQDGTGTDQVFHSWTNAGDSNGYAWPARVDDPTVAGVSVGFQPGTSLWDMAKFLLDNDWAETAWQGRTWHLFVPNSGTDYTVAGNLRRIGTEGQQVKITKDLTDYRTAETVRGEGPVEATVVGARSPWGRLEVYTTASGVGSSRHAKSYGTGDLTKYKGPSIGYTVTEAAQEAAYLPILDYQRGDWVQVQIGGTWTKLRVTQWTYAKATDGTSTVSVLLEKKKRALLHKVAHRAHRASGGRATSTSSTTPAEPDRRKAAIPQSLTVKARTTYSADKSSKSTITATWLPVTTDTDGDDLTGHHYEVHVRAEGDQYGKVHTTSHGTSADLTGLAAGATVAVAVRAVSDTGTPGELSDETEFLIPWVENPPDPPSTPTVSSTLGSITVAWDGLLVDAVDGPQPPAAGFGFVQVQRSTDGTTWVTEAQTLPAAGSVVDLGLAVGTTYQYRLVAVDSAGTASAPSAVASTQVVAIDTAQINAAFTAQVTQAASDAATAKTTAAQAQSTANSASTAASTAASQAQAAQTTASGAQTTANGKNTVYVAGAAPSGGTYTVGDLWFDSANGNRCSTWTGSGWTLTPFGALAVTNLDAGSISSGTLNALRIAAGTITASHLAIADFTNLAAGSDFEVPGQNPWTATGAWATDTTQKHSGGTAWRNQGALNNTTTGTQIAPLNVPVQTAAGDAWYVEFWAYSDAAWNGSSTGNSKLRVATQTGSLVYALNFGTADLTVGTWVKKSGTFTTPAGATALQIDVRSDATAGNVWLDDVVIRRKTAGSLIVDGTITATQIAANTITAAQIAANTITSGQIAANTITAGQIAANTITAGQLAATAIDAMTITGATFRTASTAKTSGGVQIDSTGLHGYNASGAATFTLSTLGVLTATGVNVTGTITASTGTLTTLTVNGKLTITSGGSVWTGSTAAGSEQSYFDVNGFTYVLNGKITANLGQVADSDLTWAGLAFNYSSNPTYGGVGMSSTSGLMRMRSIAGAVVQQWDGTAQTGPTSALTVVNGVKGAATDNDLSLTRTTSVSTGGTRSTDFVISDDGSPRIYSMAVRNRLNTTASGWAGGGTANGGTAVGSTNAFVVITSAGTLGVLDGSPRFPSAYSDVISTRAVFVGSTGQLGTTSSSRRTKNLDRHIALDDTGLDAWLGLATWRFAYKADPQQKQTLGVVAEEVHEAGFTDLVYYDERTAEQGGTPGQVDGFAYERMGVYNHLALKRLYARLMAAELRLAALDGKAAV